MQRIYNLKLAPKLMLVFGLVLALMLVLGGVAQYGLSSLNTVTGKLAGQTLTSVSSASQLRSMIGDYRNNAYRGLVRASDAVKQDAKRKRIVLVKQIDRGIVASEKRITDPAERALFDAFQTDWRKAYASYLQVDELVSLDLPDDAMDFFLGETQDLHNKATDSLVALVAQYDREGQAAAKDAAATYARSKSLMLVVLLASIGGGLAFASWFARALSRRVGVAVRVANEVAAGNLHGQIDVSRQDEVGALLAALATMRQTLLDFTQAQRDLALQHEQGFISQRIPVDAFQGVFAEAAQEINELVASHIAVKMRLIEVVGRYAEGDFTVDMDRLPNEKAVLTQTMDTAQANLRAMQAEIMLLVDAARQGDLGKRGDSERFQHGFRDMVAGINQTLDAIVGPVREVSTILGALAQGDLKRRIDTEYPGDFGRMRDDANTTVSTLSGIVRGIQEASGSIATAAAEISAGNQDLSQRTEQQAASLEETASSMEELTSTVRQNADNARQANQLALGATDVAQQGGQVVGQVVQTMSAINESSRRISDIIGVIDGIAFQTNILALNAAVEAARAGEQGRGFAVVAAEVRSLAQRSANAAKEIKQLITDSVMKVEEGSMLVNQAGKTMGEIVTSVRRVTDIIADISTASQEQSAGIEQINQAILQMDEGTQQNAALVEEASASATSLEEQSQELRHAVSVFQLAADAAAVAPPERTRASATHAAHTAARPAPHAPAATAAHARPPQRRRSTVPGSVSGNGNGNGSPRKTNGHATVQADGDAQHWQEF